MPDAAYYRAWRAAHPEYRKRQNEQRNWRRKAFGRADRSREYRTRPSRSRAPSFDEVPLPPLHQGHPILRKAVEIVTKFLHPDERVLLFDPLFDDAVGEAVIALIEGNEPNVLISAYLKAERARRYRERSMEG